MSATFGFSITSLRRAAFAAVLLGSTMLVVAGPAYAAPAAQATVVAGAGDAGEGASFRVSGVGDGGEGATFRVSEAGDGGEGASFRISEAGDGGEGASFRVSEAGDGGEGAARPV